MANNKEPEIRMRFGLDGKIREIDVVADSAEDRDAAIGKLRQILPSVELIETLLAEPPKGEAPDGRASSGISIR
jgi:hypothetical protein